MRGSLTNASKKYDVTGFLYFSYKQAKLVRPDEPKSKIWGVLGGYMYPLRPSAVGRWKLKIDSDSLPKPEKKDLDLFCASQSQSTENAFLAQESE